ncbi:MAG TPA: transglycosylase domain-containing protein [Propionibacteriaceae bacterium]|nr:transglycosylase domain-containing protein [Propionibacteriaceae bacterium]
MSSPRSGGKLYALSVFGIVSVACGLLVAGLFLPGAIMLSSAAKAGADAFTTMPTELTITPQMERSRILMSDGSVLAEFYDQNRVYTSLNNIAPIMRTAQVAIEDHEFYQHGAVYLQGILRAAIRNTAGGATQGASTLTQQYVKQVLIEKAVADGNQQGVQAAQAETLSRKITELRYAIGVEQKLTKNQILERYLNIAYYGDGAYGVEAAAKHYFNTTAGKLTLPEAAMLAGIVQNPDAYDPVTHPGAAMERRNIVLNRMAQLGLISEKDNTAAKATKFDPKKVQQVRSGCFSSPFPFLCQYAYTTIIQTMTSLGKTQADRINALNRDGLTIRTAIDPNVQRQAQQSMSGFIAPTDPVIGVGVTVQPSTGLITSMVQNRPSMGSGTGQTWINYAVDQSKGGSTGFQFGSTFKAFTAAAALDKGLGVNTQYYSPSPMDFSGVPFQGCHGPVVDPSWKPRNSTGVGTFNMINAIKLSINTYFIQLELHAGLCNTIKMAEAAGVKSALGLNLESPSQQFASFTLGALETTPLSMASAYATFANRGVHCDPIIVVSAVTKSNKSLAVPAANCKRVMSADVADGVNYLLQQVMQPGGTGYITRIAGFKNQAGKTGTTDSAQSVAFMGYTPEVAGAALIAADTNSSYFRHRASKDITGVITHGSDCGSSGCYLQGHGGSDAGKVWRGVMAAALQGKPDTPFHSPSKSILDGKKATVPDVSGLSLAAAKSKLQDAGFGTTTTSVYSSTYPAGAFIGTYPAAGSQVPVGSQIQLLVSSGSAPAAPPPAPTSSSSTASTPPPTSSTTSTNPHKPKKNG